MNIILGLIKNYKINDLKPFVVSLQGSGYKGHVVFFAESIPEDTIRWLEDNGVNVIKIDDSAFKQDIISVVCYRFICYRSFLQKYTTYKNVLMTDVRDVLFQRDPFDFDIEDNLYCFLEDKKTTIGECSVNSSWIGYYFGRREMRRLSRKYISCVGVTMGPCDRVMEYLNAMIDLLADKNICLKRRWGVDTAIHNHIIYKGLIKNIVFRENEYGPVLTLGNMDKEDIRMNSDEELVNKDGSVPNIVHQYDRHDFVNKVMKKKYSTE